MRHSKRSRVGGTLRALVLESLERRELLSCGTIVNTALDGFFGGDVCSLRDAITVANEFPDANGIAFDEDLYGQVIQVDTIPLPDIIHPLTINGGALRPLGETRLIEVKFTTALHGFKFTSSADASQLFDLAINTFKDYAVWMDGTSNSAIGESAPGVQIGLDRNRNVVAGNVNDGDGIRLSGEFLMFEVANSTIVNVTKSGIKVEGPDARGIRISNTRIGARWFPDKAYLAAGNKNHGIYLLNAIGVSVSGNDIVANGTAGQDYHGIAIEGGEQHVINYNNIGLGITGATGLTDAGNRRHGVSIINSFAVSVSRNFVAGNDGDGLAILGDEQNYIGDNDFGLALGDTISDVGPNDDDLTSSFITNGPDSELARTTTSKIGNTGHGISITNSDDNSINGSLGRPVKIMSNGGNGINITGTGGQTSDRNKVQIVTIGAQNGDNEAGMFVQNATDTALEPYPLDPISVPIVQYNRASGIQLGNGALNSRIESATIRNNAFDGVTVSGTASKNKITKNSIYLNGQLGIDLIGGTETAAGVTLNDNTPVSNPDTDAGTNALQNFPIITAAKLDGGSVIVQGYLKSRPSKTYNLEFFAGDVADPSFYGEGRYSLTPTAGVNPVMTDANGIASFDLRLMPPGGVTVGSSWYVTGTATNVHVGHAELNSTSEFGPDYFLGAPRVTKVEIKGTTTTHAPYTVPVGNGEQMRTVPVGGANLIAIQFDSNVQLVNNSLFLTLIAGGPATPAPTSVSYDAETHTATWTMPVSFSNSASQFVINLDANNASPNKIVKVIPDGLLGERLDGEWDNPTSLADASSDTFPSGNGTTGGNFTFDISIFPGDANRDNICDLNDRNIVGNNFGLTGQVWTAGDFTGEGNVNTDDRNFTFNEFGHNFTSWPGSLTNRPRSIAFEALKKAALDTLLQEYFDEPNNRLFEQYRFSKRDRIRLADSYFDRIGR